MPAPIAADFPDRSDFFRFRPPPGRSENECYIIPDGTLFETVKILFVCSIPEFLKLK